MVVSRVRLSRLASVAFVALCVAVPHSALAAELLVIQNVSTVQYPQVAVQIALPAALLADGTEPRFSVKENERTVEVVSATRAPETERPVDVVLAIDTSGSMKGAALASAKTAAAAFVDRMAPSSRVAVVAFSSRPRVVSRFTNNHAALKSAISGLSAGGETALYDALGSSADLAALGSRRSPSIVLLSAGGDTTSRTDLDSAIKRMRSLQIPVFTVSLPSSEADPRALQLISEQSGGRLVAVRDVGQLTSYYEGLAKQLQTRWIVLYRSARPSTKDLDIQVTAQSVGGKAQGATLLQNPLFATPLPITTGLTAIPKANMGVLTVTTILVYLAAALLVAALLLFFIKPRTGLEQLRFYDQLQSGVGELPEDAQADSNRLASRVIGAVDYVAGKRGMTRFVYERLELAGMSLRPVEYITGHILLVFGAGLLSQIVFGNVLVSLLLIVIATLAPMFYIGYRTKKRRKAFEEQLPDVLNLISGSLRAGWGMLQAIDLVAREMPAPVSTEFRRVETEARLGKPVEDALKSVSDRVDSEDFKWVVAAIAIQREVGGNLAEVLDIVASTIRDRAALRRQIDSLTAEGRLSMWILLLLPFLELMVLMLVNPRYMSLMYTTDQGLVMSAFGILLLIIGSVWMRKAIVVEV